MQLLPRLAAALLALALSTSVEAQRKNKKVQRSKQTSTAAKPSAHKGPVTLNSGQSAAPVIPQEASFKARLKKRPQVVIVPAPPPPPSRDPIPPKNP